MKAIKITSVVIKSLLSLFGIFMFVFFFGESISGVTTSLDFFDIFGMILMPFVFTIGVIVMWKKELLGSVIIILTILLLNIVFMIGQQSFSLELEFGIVLLIAVIEMVVAILYQRAKSIKQE
ncbi:MAG: hypothetical protein PHC62_04860 [Candidatus Izemoplasmatales bacterium]|jgi:hypothetical protein|nr:hypothetical protein [Candidatus Izemoplasmatales bacterium]